MVVTCCLYIQTNKKQLTLFCSLEGTFPQQFRDQKRTLQKGIKYRSEMLTAAHDKSKTENEVFQSQPDCLLYGEIHITDLTL